LFGYNFCLAEFGKIGYFQEELTDNYFKII